MKVRHRLIVRATCPVNGDRDRYLCWVTLDRVVKVEDIWQLVEELTQKPIFQEDLTQALADRLGAPVKTRGTHRRGDVLTVCVCQSKNPSERKACRCSES
jgi:hypothetical protein